MSEVIRQKNKKININRIISITILVCSIICLTYCGSVIANYVTTKKENSKLVKEKNNLALKYEYYKTLLEKESYKVIISEGNYCYEVDSNRTYKCG